MVLFAVLTVLGPAAVAAPTHIGNPCVKVTASVQPHHAHVGDVMSAEWTFANCGPSVYIKWVFSFIGPPACGPIVREHFHARLYPHYIVYFATAPPGFTACRGTYRATTEAYHDGQLLDRMSRRVHVGL
jgi:hypothetical protein